MRATIYSGKELDSPVIFDGEALVWTEQEGSVMKLIINTKAQRQTYLAPRLEGIDCNAVKLKAIVDRSESGVLQKIEEHIIILGALP